MMPQAMRTSQRTINSDTETVTPTAASFYFYLPHRSDPRFQDLLRRMKFPEWF